MGGLENKVNFIFMCISLQDCTVCVSVRVYKSNGKNICKKKKKKAENSLTE